MKPRMVSCEQGLRVSDLPSLTDFFEALLLVLRLKRGKWEGELEKRKEGKKSKEIRKGKQVESHIRS